MSRPDRSDLFDDPAGEIRTIKARMLELKEEAKTASPERRKEIGWWIYGATKHLGRLADVNLARRFGEHEFIIHEMEDGRSWAVCSCGARFPGQMHKDFTLEQFPLLDGHLNPGGVDHGPDGEESPP